MITNSGRLPGQILATPPPQSITGTDQASFRNKNIVGPVENVEQRRHGSGGFLLSGIERTLSQIIGTDTAGTSSGTSAGMNPEQQQAMGSFMNDLYSMLHPGNPPRLPREGEPATPGSPPPASLNDILSPDQTQGSSLNGGDNQSTNIGATNAQRADGPRGLEANLQRLVKRLDKSEQPPPGSQPPHHELQKLKNSFQGLLDSYGVNGDQVSLQNFIQNLSNNLLHAGDSGVIVDSVA